MTTRAFRYKTHLIWRRVVVKGVALALVSIYFSLIPTPFSQWWDYAMAAIGAWYVIALFHALKIAMGPVPQVVISNDGIRDPKIGDLLVPWSAIKEIKTHSKFGSIFLFANRDALDSGKLSIFSRYAPLLGYKAGEQHNVFPLPMTPSIALEESMDNLLSAIQAHPAAAKIDMTPV
ncbi:MAG: hypothetical protein ACR2PA_11645 [Hyphomicrobiaceae bacterium]